MRFSRGLVAVITALLFILPASSLPASADGPEPPSGLPTLPACNTLVGAANAGVHTAAVPIPAAAPPCRPTAESANGGTANTASTTSTSNPHTPTGLPTSPACNRVTAEAANAAAHGAAALTPGRPSLPP